MTTAAKKAPRTRRAKSNGPVDRWSGRVTRESDALDLDPGVFKLRSARAIARSLKKSAEASHRRRSDPYRSAISMLTFYINRGGKNLPEARKAVLEEAKAELRRLFHKPLRRGAKAA